MRNVIDTEHVSIRETSPGKRVIQTHVGTYYLDFPYIQYYLHSGRRHIRVTASKAPFSTKKSNELFEVPTFNINDDGTVCQPELRPWYATNRTDVRALDMEKSIDLFWNTSFGKELPPKGYRYLFQRVSGGLNPFTFADSKKYYDYWQKNGWFEIPLKWELFTHDPNYYKSPETYFEKGRLAIFGYGYSTSPIFAGEITTGAMTNREQDIISIKTDGRILYKYLYDVRITKENVNQRLVPLQIIERKDNLLHESFLKQIDDYKISIGEQCVT